MTEKPTYQELEEKIKELENKISTQEINAKEAEINQKRLASLWKIASMQGKTITEICDTLLEEIVDMTASQYGFYGFINQDEKRMDIYSWSKAVLDNCAIDPRILEFDIDKSGIWGNALRERRPVLYNDYNLEIINKQGMPKGHIRIKNILSVPVFSVSGAIVSLGCVANKKTGYNDKDVIQLMTYLNNAQLILDNKKAEEEREMLIEKALTELKILRGILPLCSFCKKIRDDKGYWENVDIYLHKYSQADISHSVCPDCMQKYYPDTYEKIINGGEDK